jgi:hypothetical protein
MQSKVKKHLKRVDYTQKLEEMMYLARSEQMWDDIIEDTNEKEGSPIRHTTFDNKTSWTTIITTQQVETKRHMARAGRRKAELAKRLQDIVDKETEMAAEEAKDRRLRKNNERYNRRLARRRATTDGTASQGDLKEI